jgi:hypothetical protein
MIFVTCTREARPDIQSLFPGAPRRSGFAGQVALRGKWCEGRFRIGLVNIVNGQASFQLTPVRIEVSDGKIAALSRVPLSNGQILRDFHRVSECDTLLRGIKLGGFNEGGLHLHGGGALEFYIDRASPPGTPAEAAVEQDDPECDLIVRGWAFLRGLGREGTLYIVGMDEAQDEAFIFGTSRLLRHDVQGTFQDAPLRAGFIGNLHFRRGLNRTMSGTYRLCLVNVVGETAGCAVTALQIVVRDGQFAEAGVVEISPTLRGHCSRSLEARILAEDSTG